MTGQLAGRHSSGGTAAAERTPSAQRSAAGYFRGIARSNVYRFERCRTQRLLTGQLELGRRPSGQNGWTDPAIGIAKHQYRLSNQISDLKFDMPVCRPVRDGKQASPKATTSSERYFLKFRINIVPGSVRIKTPSRPSLVSTRSQCAAPTVNVPVQSASKVYVPS